MKICKTIVGRVNLSLIGETYHCLSIDDDIKVKDFFIPCSRPCPSCCPSCKDCTSKGSMECTGRGSGWLWWVARWLRVLTLVQPSSWSSFHLLYEYSNFLKMSSDFSVFFFNLPHSIIWTSGVVQKGCHSQNQSHLFGERKSEKVVGRVYVKEHTLGFYGWTWDCRDIPFPRQSK